MNYPILVGSPAYRRLARRFARLVAFSRARGLWPDEREELERISAAMDYAQARHGIADLVDDYEFDQHWVAGQTIEELAALGDLRRAVDADDLQLILSAGDLGGAELT